MIHAAKISNRRCWRIARKTLHVDPRCRNRDILQQYTDELYDKLQAMQGDFDDSPDLFTSRVHSGTYKGALTAVMFPLLTVSFSRGTRDTADVLGIKPSESDLLLNKGLALARAQASADILVNTTATRLADMADADHLDDPYIFSKDRAKVAVNYETVRSFRSATESAIRKSGQGWGKAWLVSDEHDRPDLCDDNEAAGVIPLGSLFPSGDAHDPQHPNCECETYYVRMQ